MKKVFMDSYNEHFMNDCNCVLSQVGVNVDEHVFDLLTPVDIVVCQWSNTVHLLQNESLLTPMSLCCQPFNEETLLIDLKSLFRPHVPKTDHAHVQTLPQNPLENSK